MFEPVESRQQAKCACCRLKGGPDALLWGVQGGLRGYLGKIRRYWGAETDEKLCLGFGCRGKRERGVFCKGLRPIGRRQQKYRSLLFLPAASAYISQQPAFGNV